MLELRDGSKCYTEAVVGVNVGLACVDGAIAVLAFYQLMRIHLRNSHLGWTRQKGWSCWTYSCGFLVMAIPKILVMAAFSLLLSFWVDLCHQSNDVEEDDECSPQELLLDKTQKIESSSGGRRRCCTFRCTHVGSRQKVVILVMVLILAIMVLSAVLIWIGIGKSHVDSAVVAQVYVDLIAVVFILLGGALAFYGLLLFLKMKQVRSERTSSDMWKVAGLAIVSVISFTLSSSAAIATNIPLFYHWHERTIDAAYTTLLLVLYHFIGSSVPSAFLLFVMRELPPPAVIQTQQQSRTITFVAGHPVETNDPPRWTAAARSVQNQGSRASPI
ncbi:uncharacterized protein LOC127249576 isoform X2 [Andrographis paniculata]|uniref:uncharacterized protein LOC127249576 isoform X2 n=1 Tax=Andrographis paniculata TaxID=175694 RepID=UPI0021E856F1|nr:uncharacterized protein LOC127249576 isoform X2 [Andrographis paniculata]